jgi:6-phosphofructokinase
MADQLGILTAGGDFPRLNAAMRGLDEVAHAWLATGCSLGLSFGD